MYLPVEPEDLLHGQLIPVSLSDEIVNSDIEGEIVEVDQEEWMIDEIISVSEEIEDDSPIILEPLAVVCHVESTNFIVNDNSSTSEEEEATLSLRNQELLLAMTKLGSTCQDVVTASLGTFSDLPVAQLRYLAGPIPNGSVEIASKPPQWVRDACFQSRLTQVFEEYNRGEIGILATPADVLALLYPGNLNSFELYIWCLSEVMPKYKPEYIPGGDYWSAMKMLPVPYERIKKDFEYLASGIRHQAVEWSKKQGVGTHSHNKKKYNSPTRGKGFGQR